MLDGMESRTDGDAVFDASREVILNGIDQLCRSSLRALPRRNIEVSDVCASSTLPLLPKDTDLSLSRLKPLRPPHLGESRVQSRSAFALVTFEAP